MGLRQILPVQTKRMRFGFATVKGGEFTDAIARGNTERPQSF
jgi:hypothetical protein